MVDDLRSHRQSNPWPGLIMVCTAMVCVTAVLVALIVT